MSLLFLLTICTLVYFRGAVALAQEKKKAKDKTEVTKPQEPGQKLQKVESGEKKIYLDEIEVKGWIEKPLAIYIIPGSDPRVDDIEIDRSFMEEILKPIDKDTFEKGRRTKTVILW